MREVKPGRPACRPPRARPGPGACAGELAPVLEELRGIAERSKGNGEVLNALIAGVGDFRAALARFANELGRLNLALEGMATPREASNVRALSDVGRERLRQREAEGCAPADDDAYTRDELIEGALAYTLSARQPHAYPYFDGGAWWPKAWTRIPFKPKNRRRDLVRAAALLVAEIERIDRERERVPAVIRERIE